MDKVTLDFKKETVEFDSIFLKAKHSCPCLRERLAEILAAIGYGPRYRIVDANQLEMDKMTLDFKNEIVEFDSGIQKIKRSRPGLRERIKDIAAAIGYGVLDVSQIKPFIHSYFNNEISISELQELIESFIES